MVFGLPPFAEPTGIAIDEEPVDIGRWPPDAGSAGRRPRVIVEETLSSALLKSNCPVTGQPDWADVVVAYRGPRIDRGGLLRYLVSFRDHAEFHEQCVERIFVDIAAHCRPHTLSVEARYTRRGGLDINPGAPRPAWPRPRRPAVPGNRIPPRCGLNTGRGRVPACGPPSASSRSP